MLNVKREVPDKPDKVKGKDSYNRSLSLKADEPSDVTPAKVC